MWFRRLFSVILMLWEVCSGVCVHETLSDHLPLNCHHKVQTYSYKNLKRSDKPFCFYLPLKAEETKFRKYFPCISMLYKHAAHLNWILFWSCSYSPVIRLIQLGIFYQVCCTKQPSQEAYSKITRYWTHLRKCSFSLAWTYVINPAISKGGKIISLCYCRSCNK